MSKADNRKRRSRGEIYLKLTMNKSKNNLKNKSIAVNKKMFIGQQKRLYRSLRHVTGC